MQCQPTLSSLAHLLECLVAPCTSLHATSANTSESPDHLPLLLSSPPLALLPSPSPQANNIGCTKLVQLVAEAYKVSCLAFSLARLMAAEFVCGADATRQSINV